MAAKVIREQRIPFEVSADLFYSEENMARLKKTADLDAGKGTIHEDGRIEIAQCGSHYRDK